MRAGATITIAAWNRRRRTKADIFSAKWQVMLAEQALRREPIKKAARRRLFKFLRRSRT
jgi:hypothetical protein